MNKYIFLAVFTFTLFVSCQKGLDDNNGSGNSLAAQTILDVAYGSDAKQKLDVYLPAGRSTATTKVMIMIHGGAWSSGDKSDLNDFVDSIKKRQPDYAIININHRLATGVTNSFPTQEDDIKSAIDFIFSKTGEYHISQKFVLLGASSGAQLALLQGYKNTTTIKPKAIIDFFGPTDMVDLYNNTPALAQPLLASIVGGTPTTAPAKYQQSSPINFIGAQDPPTLIVHGLADDVVPVAQSTALQLKLQTTGIYNEFYTYAGLGHDVWPDPIMKQTFDKAEAFIKAHAQ